MEQGGGMGTEPKLCLAQYRPLFPKEHSVLAFYLKLTVQLHTAAKPLAISSLSGDLSSTIVLESGMVPVAPKSLLWRHTNSEETISRQPRHVGVGSSCHFRPSPLLPGVTAVIVARPPKRVGSVSSVQLPCGSTTRRSLAAR
jgi:hypothetical protein